MDVSYTRLGDTSAQYFAEALKWNNTLTTINLGDNGIGDVGANAFVDMFKSNTTLKELNLEGNNITDIGAKAIADALVENTSLQSLLLGGNLIHAEGALAIIEVLRHNTSLKLIDLRCVDLEDYTDEIVDIITDNTTITELYIGHIPERIRNIIRRNRAL